MCHGETTDDADSDGMDNVHLEEHLNEVRLASGGYGRHESPTAGVEGVGEVNAAVEGEKIRIAHCADVGADRDVWACCRRVAEVTPGIHEEGLQQQEGGV